MKTRWLSPVVSGDGSGETLYHDNSNRIARIASRFPAYARMFLHRVSKGMPLSDIVAGTMVGQMLPERKFPAQVSLELTNNCNIQCGYCPNHLGLRPGGYMDEGTCSSLLSELRKIRVPRIHICGNGEPSLHPEFGSLLPKLAASTRFISLVSNGQWNSSETVSALLNSVDMLHVSVEGNSPESYQKGRCGGDFARLIRNLEMLQAEKQHSGKKILINVRLMLHPSERSSEAQLVNFWRKYGDTVTREYVKQLQCFDTQTEVYVPLQSKTRATPICIKPGFLLNVFWNGDVPLCGDMCLLRDSPNALLGNINGNSILEMWNMPLLQQLREGHRCGDEIEMCRGCHGQ